MFVEHCEETASLSARGGVEGIAECLCMLSPTHLPGPWSLALEEEEVAFFTERTNNLIVSHSHHIVTSQGPGLAWQGRRDRGIFNPSEGDSWLVFLGGAKWVGRTQDP